MKYLIITIAAVVLVGCGDSQEPIPQTETKPTEPDTDIAKSETPTAKGTDYSGKYTLSMAESDTALNFELKPDGSFLGKSSTQVNDDLIGSWKVEGELLICEGTTEKSSQIIVFKFNKSTKKWISVSADGEEESIEDAIPEGEDGLYLKKN
tara:strand:+ start:92 stop:544 length:453 start_codon:yes stop_codon:yes gene_type:complete